MIDGEDVTDFILISPTPTTAIGCCVVLVIVGLLLAAASVNSEECSKKECAGGATPTLMEGKCLCVEEAK